MSNLKNRVLKIEATQVKPPNYSHLTREEKIVRIEELDAMQDVTFCPSCPDFRAPEICAERQKINERQHIVW